MTAFDVPATRDFGGLWVLWPRANTSQVRGWPEAPLRCRGALVDACDRSGIGIFVHVDGVTNSIFTGETLVDARVRLAKPCVRHPPQERTLTFTVDGIRQTKLPREHLLWMFEVTSCASNTSIAILLRSNSVSCGVPQHRQTRFVVIAIAMSLSTTLWSVQEHTVDCSDTYGVVFTHRKGSRLSWQLPLRDVRDRRSRSSRTVLEPGW